LSGTFVGNTRTPITFAVYSSDVLGGYPQGENSVTR
jgi:hypothetical protein